MPLELRPEDIERIAKASFDVVIFQGVEGPGAVALVEALRAVGTKTIFAAGDLVTAPMVAKPNTRMTMLKSLGLPIVASPNLAFTGTLTHGESCYFARTVDEWIDALETLGEFERRAAIGLTDREQIVNAYGSTRLPGDGALASSGS